MKKQRFLIKLLTIYAMIIFVYTLVASSISFVKDNQITQTVSANNLKSYLAQVKESIDTKLMITINLVNRLKNDESAKRYIQEPDLNFYNLSTVYNELNKDAGAFANSGYTLAISKISDDTVITPAYTSRVKEHFSKLGADGFNYQEVIDKLNTTKAYNNYYTLRSQAVGGTSTFRNFLTIIKKDVLDLTYPFYIFLSFDEDVLLPQIHSDTNESFVILRNNEIITMRSNMDSAQIKKLLSGVIPQDKKISEPFFIKTKNDYILVDTSKVYDWQYVYIYPIVNAKSKSQYMFFNALILCLSLLIIGILLMFPIVKRIYNPIKSIVDIFNISPTSEIEDEISYIKESALNIKDNNEKLKQIIKNSKLPLKIKFLRDITLGLADQENIEPLLQQHELEFLKNNAIVVLMELANSKELNESFDKETIQTIQNQILDVMRIEFQKHYPIEIFQLDYSKYAAFINCNDIDTVKKLLQHILLEVEANYDLTFSAVVSNLCSSISEIEKSFQTMMNYIDNRYYNAKNSVVSITDVQKNDSKTYYYPLNEEKLIITHATTGDNNERMFQILDNILSENLERRTLNKELLSQFIFSIVGTINRILHITNKNMEDFFDEGTVLYMELKMCSNLAELKRKIIEIFEKIISELQSEQQGLDTVLANDMLSYIHENYMKDISLSDLAQHFNLSQCYTSTLFKEHTGNNFKDYLNMHRVNMSKKLLDENPYIKIKDLSEMIGCNSSNSFIRMFTRYEGKSPKQYVKERDCHTSNC